MGGERDITDATLMRCWGLAGGTGRLPDPEELAAARAIVGMDRIELDEEQFTVRFKAAGVALDLGGIGKGYALERAAALLAESRITSALLRGGTSSTGSSGAPPGQEHSSVAIHHPPSPDASAAPAPRA